MLIHTQKYLSYIVCRLGPIILYRNNFRTVKKMRRQMSYSANKSDRIQQTHFILQTNSLTMMTNVKRALIRRTIWKIGLCYAENIVADRVPHGDFTLSFKRCSLFLLASLPTVATPTAPLLDKILSWCLFSPYFDIKRIKN